MIQGKNFAGQINLVADTEYHNCNFSQPAPSAGPIGVKLFPGDDTPRTFVECNLVNATPPPGSILINCNTTIRESAIEDSVEVVEIDGYEISASSYVDRIYGRTDPDTLLPDLLITPIDDPVEVES